VIFLSGSIRILIIYQSFFWKNVTWNFLVLLSVDYRLDNNCDFKNLIIYLFSDLLLFVMIN